MTRAARTPPGSSVTPFHPEYPAAAGPPFVCIFSLRARLKKQLVVCAEKIPRFVRPVEYTVVVIEKRVPPRIPPLSENAITRFRTSSCALFMEKVAVSFVGCVELAI